MDKKKSENEEFIEYLEKQVIDEKQLLWRIYNLPMHKRYAIGQMLSLADKVRTGECSCYKLSDCINNTCVQDVVILRHKEVD
jgi:hypothetical protein